MKNIDNILLYLTVCVLTHSVPALVDSQVIRIPAIVLPRNDTESCVPDELRVSAQNDIISDVYDLLTAMNVCGEGDWQQVANLNMSDLAQQCPSEWMEYSTIRSCGRPDNVHLAASCASTFFSTSGRQYTMVCGRAVGYQYSTTDAFFRVVSQPTGTPDDNYVDGLSVTHGSNPRKHIWTFAAGLLEAHGDNRGSVCPCATPNGEYGTAPPLYVGKNYFCETGNPENSFFHDTHYVDPLWDGQGCVNSECCTFNSPPWFSVTLPNPTTDDIEVRICSDQTSPDSEDTTVEVLELYIQ